MTDPSVVAFLPAMKTVHADRGWMWCWRRRRRRRSVDMGIDLDMNIIIDNE